MGHNLQVLWDGTPIDVGAMVKYKCAPGTWFVHDRNEVEFEVECLEDNNYAEPFIWPSCVQSMILIRAVHYFGQS